jgi:hypothetical protein
MEKQNLAESIGILKFFHQISGGIYDSLQFPVTLFCVYGSNTLSRKVVEIMGKNLTLFLGLELFSRFVYYPIWEYFGLGYQQGLVLYFVRQN